MSQEGRKRGLTSAVTRRRLLGSASLAPLAWVARGQTSEARRGGTPPAGTPVPLADTLATPEATPSATGSLTVIRE